MNLLFKGSKTGSYLTIEPKEGSRVPVAAWEVSAEDELALDRYEGFPTFYYKKEMLLPIKGITEREDPDAEYLSCTSCTRTDPLGCRASFICKRV